MSVTLINIFEVPADDADAFIAAWEKSRDYLMKLPAHIETALHQSLHDTRFRFVNIAQWTSEGAGQSSEVLVPAVLHAGLPASAQREKRSIFSWGQAPAQGMVPACSWARMAPACWLTSS